MSLLTIHGETFAAGMSWLPRVGDGDLAATARDLDASAFVHTDHQTGFAADDEGDPTSTISLAVAVHAAIGSPDWIAAIADDDGKVAVVRCASQRLEENPKEARLDAEAAAGILLRSDKPRHAPPSLGIDTAQPLDLSGIRITDGMRLEPAPAPSRIRGVVKAVASVAILGGVALAGWQFGPLAWEIFFPPEPEPVAVVEERRVMTVTDTSAFLALCDAALRADPPGFPGWRLDEAACQPRLADTPILEEIPNLAGRPVLVLRWSLRSGHDPEINRRLMEEVLLAGRGAVQVQGSTAWAVTVLDPVIVETELTDPRQFRELRAAVDRHVGAWASDLSFAHDGRAWRIVASGSGSLARLARATSAVPDIEVTAVSRAHDGTWRLTAQPLTPIVVLESVFETLTRPLAPQTETGHAEL